VLETLGPALTPSKEHAMPKATENNTTPLRGYIIEGLALTFILLAGCTASSLIATVIEGKFAQHCAQDLQQAVQ
jgi:hypothetical protein